MKRIQVLIHICQLVVIISYPLKAQTPFREGVLTYKADTIRRLESIPAAYIISKVVVFKKDDLLRIEIWRFNRLNKSVTEKLIQIWNKKGTYLFSEHSEPIWARVDKSAIFMTHEEEQQLQNKRSQFGAIKSFAVNKVSQHIKWFNLDTEKVELKGGQEYGGALPEAIVSTSINIPMSKLFDSAFELPGTPLQFPISEYGWLIQLTATTLKQTDVPDNLFEINTSFKLKSMADICREMADFK
ncbi:hypothetical protein [Spirosoma panaciterrae]|uniref:hypothetical protein n=1 Tax=Spirosoma panaciterrae TaxID=496058 RepID=UPI00037D68EF|nr:hypothetical protein [Spirosoma panaciterrae]